MSPVRDVAGCRDVWPLLEVSDLEVSLRHYTDRLGFEVVGRAANDRGPYWCRVRRGAVSLMLQQADEPLAARPGAGVALYVVCDDVDAFADEIRERGVDALGPFDAPYGMRQLRIPDPDGYEVWFETPTGDWSG